MPGKTITTLQGEAWDQVAKNHAGSEYAMARLLSANWDNRGVLLFSGDIPVTIPETDATAVPASKESLAPWKRES